MFSLILIKIFFALIFISYSHKDHSDTQLTTLDLSLNGISKIENLETLTQLKLLDVRFNKELSRKSVEAIEK